jgi:hypothetical protein
MFYSYIDDHLSAGPFVQFSDGSFLHLDLLDTYTFPVNGYYYFATEQEAKDFFGITE